jgi:hypothetical protein
MIEQRKPKKKQYFFAPFSNFEDFIDQIKSTNVSDTNIVDPKQQRQ